MQYERLRAIRVGMTEKEVRGILGPADEVRAVDKEELLDGIAVYSSHMPHIRESYRWAYGPRLPHAFAVGGIVSFDAHGRVVGAKSPLGFFEQPHNDQVVASRNGLSCHVGEVHLEEKRGQSATRLWFAKVTITNGGERKFARECFVDSIARLSAVEIYTKDRVLIFRNDRSESMNGFLSPSSTFVVSAGASRTEEVVFMPDVYFGQLPPGIYLLRVCFRDGAESFIGSNLYEFSVPNWRQPSEWIME